MFTYNPHEGVTYPEGFVAAGVKAGIKKSGNLDVAVLYSQTPAQVAAVFTQNAVAAAPVWVSKEVVQDGQAQAIVANAGCANACTGAQGLADAKETAKIAAAALQIPAENVLVASTGVIGVCLPMEKMKQGVQDAIAALAKDGAENASQAIITTDTHPKICAGEVTIDDMTVHFGAMAKGSGMIQPNMATMLAFITTDAAIEAKLLQEALSEVTETTFNMISVDGDMSTNDMAVVLANGMAKNPVIHEKGAAYETFKEALHTICETLAKDIAADGEGATKFLTVHVTGAKNFVEAKEVAMCVAKSPLVKTAFFGEDPNWGRVICAVGYAKAEVHPEQTVVSFGGLPVYARGTGCAVDAEKLHAVMQEKAIPIEIALHVGEAEATVWTCDFSYEYVKINGEYHT